MTQPILPGSIYKERSICPFIGLSDDPGTALSYPSTSNCCHHVNPVASIKRSHQAKYCLDEYFTKCRIFKCADPASLPDAIAEVQPVDRPHHRRILLVFSMALMVTIAVWILFANGAFGSQPESSEQVNINAWQTITKMVVLTQTSETQTVIPTATTKPLPTNSPEPTISVPANKPAHQLDVPFGTNPQFVIHQVETGESYMRFMQDFNTTKEAILAVNYDTGTILWADSILIIPVNVQDPTGLPSFTAFQVTEKNLSIESLAASQHVDLTQLELYNDLPAGYIFTEGEWVLIPH